ncbi:MAG: hypothetical protein COT33_00850 [Candidatus Nealsonbacteria bacterium CG08_land_8_20_14_0_20_38_20]|uniref:Uncharacterized protein n=1 Tax=Candidatus Nealsonbacteria bacterium CG08_land_8_20_14_0_20_38_20 TaxID=1974705 RepID=A0A2H0YMC8_9BACT|nr:MAG: hypothetical protein COT33_00850 [Candidatus Nealsonbacteria bacterium CG08_land_8_20_14_0_20_38_20]
MANQSVKNSMTILKEAVQKKGGLVILPLKEYKKLCERAIPTYYLKGKEAEKLDKLVEEGLREHERGETISAPSIKEALKIYERKKDKRG